MPAGTPCNTDVTGVCNSAFNRCVADGTCPNITSCVKSKGCRTIPECYKPDFCKDVIDAAARAAGVSVPGPESLTKARALESCVVSCTTAAIGETPGPCKSVIESHSGTPWQLAQQLDACTQSKQATTCRTACTSSGGGPPRFCPTPATDTACTSRGGTCQTDTTTCSGGSYVSCLCSGAPNRRCCVPSRSGSPPPPPPPPPAPSGDRYGCLKPSSGVVECVADSSITSCSSIQSAPSPCQAGSCRRYSAACCGKRADSQECSNQVPPPPPPPSAVTVYGCKTNAASILGSETFECAQPPTDSTCKSVYKDYLVTSVYCQASCQLIPKTCCGKSISSSPPECAPYR